MTIFVRMPTGEIINIQVHATDTFKIIKGYIKNKAGIPRNQQRLIFADGDLEDDCTPSDYNIHKGATISLALRLAGGAGNKRKKTEEGDDASTRAKIDDFVGMLPMKDGDCADTKAAYAAKDTFAMDAWLESLTIMELEQLKALATKYEKNGIADSAIRAYSTLWSSMARMKVRYFCLP